MAKRGRKLYRAVKTHLGGDLDRALALLTREGAVKNEAMAWIARMIETDLAGDMKHAMFLLQLEVELVKKGLSTTAAASLAELAQGHGLAQEDAEGALGLGADLLELRRSRRGTLSLAKLANDLGLSEKDALYCLELGDALALRGFRFEDLPDFDRRFCRR